MKEAKDCDATLIDLLIFLARIGGTASLLEFKFGWLTRKRV